LTSQLRRAASAIPANIAEGCGHGSQKEFARFLQISVASSHELHYHLMLSRDLGFLPLASFARLEARTEQVKKMLGGLLAKVRSDLQPKPVAVSRRP
jgi:four helix bundle protein